MICRSKRARHEPKKLLFIPCVLALGCSSHSEAVSEIGSQARVPLISGKQQRSEYGIHAPSRVPLASEFKAIVAPDPSTLGDQPAQFQWGGEAISVVDTSGPQATLRCTWSGFHTIEAQVNDSSFKAQIYCSPPCTDSTLCPTVPMPTTKDDFPHSNILVRIRAASNSRCPAQLGGWTGGALIDAPRSHSRGADAADVVDRFCSYSWAGSDDSIPAPPSGVDWVYDRPRVAPHATTDDANAALAARGEAALGRIHWAAVSTEPVRIAVIDTAAGAWGDPDNNPHGVAVGTLAFDTACGDQTNCDVRVENYLGLPLYRDQSPSGRAIVRRDTAHGGSFGAHGDLVQAILDAVDAAPDTHTILNLSLAYEAELESNQKPEVSDYENRVVLEALYYARCKGAIILAAAGNGPVPVDAGQLPGLPARWAGLPALSTTECHARFNTTGVNPPGPLVYPVSGLDFAAQPLLTTRGLGQSVIAALGFYAVRKDPLGAYTRRLTGTSMATATVSGILASLWSHAGKIPADRLMSDLYSGGDELTAISPDFAPLGDIDPTKVRRITRCSILNAEKDFATAYAGKDFATCDPAKTDALPEPVPGLPTGGPPPGQPRGIEPWKLPWAFPTPPGEPACGACTLRSNWLDLYFRSSFAGTTVSSMRIVSRSTSKSALRLMNGVTATSPDVTNDWLAADIPAQTGPYTVTLDEAFENSVAAELSYQVSTDLGMVDATESVLLDSEDAGETASGGAAGSGGAIAH